MNPKERIACILPAAGSGERMGIHKPKQFCMVAGKPLICHTLEVFFRIPWIYKIIVVAAPDCERQMQETLHPYMADTSRVEVVKGMNTRHKSIAAGIQALTGDPPDFVIIHDGVRPFVPYQIIEDMVQTVRNSRAVGVTRPLVSTVIAVNDEGQLTSCLDRSKYLASEMPQTFQFNLIRDAYDKCSEHDLTYGTECLNLVLTYCNVRAKILQGPPELWKVTHKKDLYAVECLLKETAQIAVHACVEAQGSAFHKKLLGRICENYALVEEVNCINQVHIHGNKSIAELIDYLACTKTNNQLGGKNVHITHDASYLETSDALRLKKKAKESICGSVIICCTCSTFKIMSWLLMLLVADLKLVKIMAHLLKMRKTTNTLLAE